MHVIPLAKGEGMSSSHGQHALRQHGGGEKQLPKHGGGHGRGQLPNLCRVTLRPPISPYGLLQL